MSAIQQFHYKLHNEEIKLEEIKKVYSSRLTEWNLIKSFATFTDRKLVKEVEELFHKVFKNFMEYSPMVNGEVVSDEINGNYRKVETWTTMEELKSLPRGFGGRIGVVLYTPEKYIFNISDWGLVSDFGGGLRARYSPYQALCKKLVEECPQWKDEICSRMRDSDVKVHCIESFHRYDEKKTKGEMRFEFLVFIRFDMKLLSSFRPTDRVKKIMIVPKSKLSEVIASGKANPGLVQLNKVK